MALLQTLQSLEKNERAEFRLFLQSPFFTAGVRNHRPENLAGLLDFLLENDSDDENFDRNALNTRLFPDKPAAEATLNSLASELHRLLKEFLQIIAARDEPEVVSMLSLARFYRKRGLEKDFLKTAETLERLFENTPPASRNLEFYRLRYLADLETCLFESQRNTKSGDVHLAKTMARLDTFFAFGKLEYAANLWHQQSMVSLDFEEMLPTADVLKMMANSPAEWLPVIRCYQKAMQILQAVDETEMTTQFADFQELMANSATEIPTENRRLLHTLERNFCARLCRTGQPAFIQKLFELYKKHLDEGFLFESGGLLASVFQSLVRTGLRLGETTWVAQFLADFPPSRIVFCQFPEDVHRFNEAAFHFHRRDFPRTLQCLQQRYEDNYYVLDSNLLELKLYYERRNWNLLDNKLNSFKVNLFKKSKQWLPPARHEAINRFIDLLRQLMHDRIQVERSPSAIEKLKLKIADSPSLAEREWLLEKIGGVNS